MSELLPSEAKQLSEFAEKYRGARIIEAGTIREGYVSLITPIKTICGPEIYCHPDNFREVHKIVRGEQ